MRDEDRVFLAEFATSICYTHPMTALALHRAAADADEVAITTESLMRGVDRPAAEARAATDRTAALVQRNVVAQLLAQLAWVGTEVIPAGSSHLRREGLASERDLGSRAQGMAMPDSAHRFKPAGWPRGGQS